MTARDPKDKIGTEPTVTWWELLTAGTIVAVLILFCLFLLLKGVAG